MLSYVLACVYYASRKLNEAKPKYTTIEKELLMVMYAVEKFRPYFLCSTIIVYNIHYAFKHLLENKEAMPHPIKWILLL